MPMASFPFGLLRFAPTTRNSFNVPSLFKVVPIFHSNLLEHFHFKHVQLQLWVHVVPYKCKTQLVPRVKTFQLIEQKAREKVASQSMFSQY